MSQITDGTDRKGIHGFDNTQLGFEELQNQVLHLECCLSPVQQRSRLVGLRSLLLLGVASIRDRVLCPWLWMQIWQPHRTEKATQACAMFRQQRFWVHSYTPVSSRRPLHNPHSLQLPTSSGSFPATVRTCGPNQATSLHRGPSPHYGSLWVCKCRPVWKNRPTGGAHGEMR